MLKSIWRGNKKKKILSSTLTQITARIVSKSAYICPHLCSHSEFIVPSHFLHILSCWLTWKKKYTEFNDDILTYEEMWKLSTFSFFLRGRNDGLWKKGKVGNWNYEADLKRLVVSLWLNDWTYFILHKNISKFSKLMDIKIGTWQIIFIV